MSKKEQFVLGVFMFVVLVKLTNIFNFSRTFIALILGLCCFYFLLKSFADIHVTVKTETKREKIDKVDKK